MSKFKVGDKVVPRSKSIIGPLEYSIVWQRAIKKKQPFLFVVKIDGQLCFCHEKYPSAFGDFFLESDLRPFEEIQARIEPKEKAPIYYTLTAPESVKEEPDYKGFYDFMMKYDNNNVSCNTCFLDLKGYCAEDRSCLEARLFYAENKFIKRG